MMDTERADRLKLEAQALRYVFTLPPDERGDAADKLADATLELVGTVKDCNRLFQDGRHLELVDLEAILASRRELHGEADALREAGAADYLDPTKGCDPDKLKAVYSRALEDTARAGELRRVEAAEDMLAKAKTATTAADRRALLNDAGRQLERAERATEGTLAETWQAHLDAKAAPEAGPDLVLRLNPTRGPWAAWFNDWLGTRAGLEAGETFILGAAPEAGKTSLAALLAVDALAVGCPVLFWQLELSREETLEHLQAQLPDPAAWWTVPFWNRARRPLPPTWADLLTVPRWPAPDAESVEAALVSQARKAERARKLGTGGHAVNGLVLVDYAQLLTIVDKKPKDAGHEILATAASRLAKAAAEAGACLVLLSQLNKADQKEGTAGGTALAGADLARMAHRVALLQKADADGKACKDADAVDFDLDKGEARLLTWKKARGVRYDPAGRRPDTSKPIWIKYRAFHNGDLVPKGKDWGDA